MKNFIFGVVIGIVASTIGFSSLAPILDSGVHTIQRFAIETRTHR